MAHDRDELERDLPADDEEVRGVGDEEFDEDDQEDDEEAIEEEDLTGEVGSEGGSPGEAVRTPTRERPARGREATETIDTE